MARIDGLTDRQLDVLELALLGLTTAQIAKRLILSHDTVKTHFKRIYAGLLDHNGQPATGALHAVTIALRKGWLVYDPETKTITRPPGRTPLPAYVELATHDHPRNDKPVQLPQAAPRARSVAQRRRDLGW